MRPTVRFAAVAAIVAMSLPAFAADLDRPDASALARRAAAGDVTAHVELLDAESVGGDPVDIAAALGDASPTEEQARLAVLATVVTWPPPPPTVGDTAQAILAEPRFTDAAPSWWDRLWRRLLTRLLDFLSRLGSVPGGGLVAATVILAAVVVLAAAVVAELGRRRARRVQTERSLRRAVEMGLDPAEVEGSADAAAARGDWAEAVRLRFLAGLLRLDREGTIRLAPGLTNHEVAESVGSPDFDRLAAQFDAIVYGGRPAGPDDDAAARTGWARLLGAAVR